MNDDDKKKLNDENSGVKEEKVQSLPESSEVKPADKPKKKRGRPSKKKVVASAEERTEQRVTVTSLWLGRLIIRNTPSGEDYTFEHAGAEVSVREQDIEFLKGKNAEIAACCGSGPNERKYFEF